jgi:hypothetical protein
MRIVDAEYQFDRAKITFYYTANLRVDFRELISKLFSIFQTRVWLKKLNTNLVFDPPQYAVSALRTGVLIPPPTGFSRSRSGSPPMHNVSPGSSVSSSSASNLNKGLGPIGSKPVSPPLAPVVAVFVPGGAVPHLVDFSEEEVMAQYMPSDSEEEEDGYDSETPL